MPNAAIASNCIDNCLLYSTAIVTRFVKVYMPLLDRSQHALVALNTEVLRNTHKIMHAAQQYMFRTSGLKFFRGNDVGFS